MPLDTVSENLTEACYGDSLQHILAHLERIDLLLQDRVRRARAVFQGDSAFQGLYISEEQVDALLARPAGLPVWAQMAMADNEVSGALEEMEVAIEHKAQESLKRNTRLRLRELEICFGLSPFERDVILVCLAPELDIRYERLYAYLQDDVTRKRPGLDLVLNLLTRSMQDKIDARARFYAGSPLLSHGLLNLTEDASQPDQPMLGRYLKIDPRIVAYLLGNDDIPAALASFVHLEAAPGPLQAPDLAVRDHERLSALVRQDATNGQGVFFYFHGPRGVGKRELAGALSGTVERRLLRVDLGRMLGLQEPGLDELLTQIKRELLLQDALLYLQDMDALLAEDRVESLRQCLESVNGIDSIVFMGGERHWVPSQDLQERSFVSFALPLPEYDARLKVWQRELLHESGIAPVELQDLANEFRLSAGQIRTAVRTARNLALAEHPEKPMLAYAHLNSACRLHSNTRLGSLAQRIAPRYHWGDIVLPAEQFAQLREIYNSVKYRSVVYKQWGFDQKLSLGKGLNVLLSGPSGTGKTMSAEIFATELGLDLYKIDLSAVVSKYIGETEKNISRIFDEAATSNAILFFDEADALFGKRTEVKDSHDRYANIETGYLLQRIEEYEGIVILATNLRNNLDDAFVRRIAFMISFPLPEKDDRLRIWEKVWPEQVPLDDDLDLEFMARQFKLAGGDIKNIALAAAFLAVDDDRRVQMRHIIHATKRELQKIGRICVKTDFGPYYSLIAA